MVHIICELWNGNLSPCEHSGANDAEAYHLLCLMDRNRETLWEGLTAAQRESFQKYLDCTEEYLHRRLELAFRDGFCLGGKLTVEMML